MKSGIADSRQRRLGSIDIARILRREFDREGLERSSRLPPGRAFAKTYGAARGTVREALNQLANENLVEIRPGRALMSPQKK